jgi:hypothetical protein
VCELSSSDSAESRSETGGATESVATGSARILEATPATSAHAGAVVPRGSLASACVRCYFSLLV